MRPLLSLLVAASLAGCYVVSDPAPPPQPPPPPDEPEPEPFSITLERTACFGFCPIYTVTVDDAGEVVFEGERFVDQTGRHTAQLDATAVAELRALARDAEFFSLDDCYCERRITDLPSAIVTVRLGNRDHRVEHYAGDPSAPDPLVKLQKAIDHLANTHRWIGDGARPAER